MKIATASDEELLAAVVPPSDDMLRQITAAAAKAQTLQAYIARLEDDLDQAQKELRELCERVLPAYMDEAGTPLIGLEDGTQLHRTDAVYASISKANAKEACAWLDAHGYGAIVKEAINISLARGDRAASQRIRDLLSKSGVPFDAVTSVHPQTLAAFVRESLEEGRELPASISVHIQPTVELKTKKEKKPKPPRG